MLFGNANNAWEYDIITEKKSADDTRGGRMVDKNWYREFGFSETISVSVWPRAMSVGIENVSYNNGMGLLTWEIVTLKGT